MSDRIPKLVKGVAVVDLRGLPLGPIDGFVLSRIDGTMNVREIAATTGLGDDAVLASLAKLESLGLLEMAQSSKAPPPPRLSSSSSQKVPSGLPRSPSSPSVHITVTRRGSSQPAPPPRIDSPAPPPAPSPAPAAGPPARVTPPMRQAIAKYDPNELDEDIDLSPEQRQKVADLYNKLNEIDYYALLGIPRAADKKTVKRAYFELASHFHPDKFFRKRLGNFKGKMEAIFGRITEAHDTLTSKVQRPEYDAYLGAQEQSRGIETMMESAMAEVRRAEEELSRTVQRSTPPASGSATIPRPQSNPAMSAAPRTMSQPAMARPSTPAADPQALRAALARRLMGGAAPMPVRQTPGAKASTNYASSQDAVDALRRRYEDRLNDAHNSQARKYTDAAKEALAKKDLVGAANAYRVALSFAPNDAALKAEYDAAQSSADTLLAESYLKQALYEERFEHWPEAAKSWGRLARARPEDARAFERHAHSLVKASGNLHEAAASAKRAVAMESSRADYKLTLATVYLAAGLTLNAKRELEAAIQIEPENANIQAMLKLITKAG